MFGYNEHPLQRAFLLFVNRTLCSLRPRMEPEEACHNQQVSKSVPVQVRVMMKSPGASLRPAALAVWTEVLFLEAQNLHLQNQPVSRLDSLLQTS